MSERSLLMPGDCASNETLFSSANDAAMLVCQSCVQLTQCGLQSQEIARELWRRGYKGQTIIAGEAVDLGPPATFDDPREVLRPTELEWNLRVLPENPAQVLQVLRQAHLTKAIRTSGTMHESMALPVYLALSELTGENTEMDSTQRFNEARHIARSLHNQRARNGAPMAISQQEAVQAKEIIKLFMHDVFYFHAQEFKQPGNAALYHSEGYYRRLRDYYSTFLPHQVIKDTVDKSPAMAFNHLEVKRAEATSVWYPQRPGVSSYDPPKQKKSSKPKSAPTSPSGVVPPHPVAHDVGPEPELPADVEVSVAAQSQEGPELELESSSSATAPLKPLRTAPISPGELLERGSNDPNLDGALAAEGDWVQDNKKAITPRGRIDKLDKPERAAVYLVHGILLPHEMRAEGWHRLDKVQQALGLQSRKEIVEYVTQQIMPRIRNSCTVGE